MCVCVQIQERSDRECEEVKGQQTSVREEAQRQVQEVTTQLQTKSSHLAEKERELAEKERELADLRSHKDHEVAELKQQISDSNTQQEKLQKVCTCVCGEGNGSK